MYYIDLTLRNKNSKVINHWNRTIFDYCFEIKKKIKGKKELCCIFLHDPWPINFEQERVGKWKVGFGKSISTIVDVSFHVTCFMRISFRHGYFILQQK